MSTSKEQLMRFAESALKQTAIYQRNCEMGMPDEENYKMSYLLVEGSINKPERVLAYAVNDQAVLLFHPMEKPMYESLLNDWDFNFDYDLFQYLEGGFDLIAMTPDAIQVYGARLLSTTAPVGSRAYKVCRNIFTTASSMALRKSDWPVKRAMTVWM